MTLRDHLLTLSEVYCRHAGLSAARLATIVHRDGKFFSRLAAGGDVYTVSYERIMCWFADHWPPDAPWPADVPRPAQSLEGRPDAA